MEIAGLNLKAWAELAQVGGLPLLYWGIKTMVRLDKHVASLSATMEGMNNRISTIEGRLNHEHQ